MTSLITPPTLGVLRVDAQALKQTRWKHISEYEEHMDTINIAKLRFAGAIEIGSKALGVGTSYSDNDFVILRKHFHELTNGLYEKDELAINNYFTAYPKTGNNTMLNKLYTEDGLTDILLLEHESDLETVRDAMSAVKHFPKSVLANKSQRIALFEEALLARGFKEPWRRRLAKLVLDFGRSKDHSSHISIRRF